MIASCDATGLRDRQARIDKRAPDKTPRVVVFFAPNLRPQSVPADAMLQQDRRNDLLDPIADRSAAQKKALALVFGQQHRIDRGGRNVDGRRLWFFRGSSNARAHGGVVSPLLFIRVHVVTDS